MRTCGHAAHLRCVETHTLSLFQKAGLDQPYDGRFAANIDDGEFLCPLCKQLSNILVPRDRSFAARKRDVDTADGAKLMSQKKMLSSSVHSAPSLRRALTRIVRPGNSGRQRDDAAFKATRHFGEQLYQAMLISWDRSSRRRQQKAWDPLVRQWDFEEQDDNEAGMMVDSEEGGGERKIGSILRLLRQQHIAWSAVGHSAAAAEASARGTPLKPGSFLGDINDPWSGYKRGTRDKHPPLLELCRMITATAGLAENLSLELSHQLGDESTKLNSDGEAPDLIGGLVADIVEGRHWTETAPSSSALSPEKRQCGILTALLSAMPCHVARDGTVSRRHEARATAAAMWTVRGLGVPPVPGVSHSMGIPMVSATADASMRSSRSLSPLQERVQGTAVESAAVSEQSIPAPLAIQRVCSIQAIRDASASANDASQVGLEASWGTMNPSQAALHGPSSSGGLLFRPAAACGFLYLPLLAWDLNTLTGAVFSLLLADGGRADDEQVDVVDMMASARTLLLGRMVQVLITPNGFHAGDGGDDEGTSILSDLQENWTEKEVTFEADALLKLFVQCRTAVGLNTSVEHLFYRDGEFLTSEHAARFLRSVGLAILPFARMLVLLLRACTSATRLRWGKGDGDENNADLDSILRDLLEDPETMCYEDGFYLLKLIGGPLPTQIINPGLSEKCTGEFGNDVDSLTWRALIQRWLVAVSALKTYHVSTGETFVYDFGSEKWVQCEDSEENIVAVQMNTNDLVSGENVNEMDKIVVRSTSEIRGIGGDIVEDDMVVEVEVVYDIMRDVLDDRKNEDEDEK